MTNPEASGELLMIWVVVIAGAAVIFLKQYLPGMDELSKKQRVGMVIRDIVLLVSLLVLLILWAWYNGVFSPVPSAVSVVA